MSEGPSSTPDERTKLLSTWTDFCNRLCALGSRVLEPQFPGAETNPANGYRLLANIISVGLQWTLNFGDPIHPAFFTITDDVTLFGATNADIRYLYARIRADLDYRVSGNCRGTEFSLEVITHFDHSSFKGLKTVASMTSKDCEIAPDGSFVVSLGPTAQSSNWVRTQPAWENTTLLLREYYHEWDKREAGEYYIAAVNQHGPPASVTPDGLIRTIDAATAWIERATDSFGMFANDFQIGPDNTVPTPRVPPSAPFLAYGLARFNLAADEALIIEFEPPEARSYSFQIYNMWAEQLDWANRMASLNAAQIHLDSDGRGRIVVAHADPGIANWLDTAGYGTGLIYHRISIPRRIPATKSLIVKFDMIRAHLPHDTPLMTGAQRLDTIATRREQVNRRFRT